MTVVFVRLITSSMLKVQQALSTTSWCKEGVEEQLHSVLSSTLDSGEWSSPRSGCFISGERVNSFHWTGGWMGQRWGL